MPIAQISNPLGINAAQGNEVYTSPTIIPFGADPAGNANTITGMTTANPTVITTTAAHGFITGKQVLVNTSTAFVATGTLPTAGALRRHGPERYDVLDPVQLHRDVHLRWRGLPELPARPTLHPSELERHGLWRSLSPYLPDRGDTAADHRLQGSGRCHRRVRDTLSTFAPPPVYGASWVVQVQTSGSVQAYVDATTSSSPTNLSQSVATPGAGKTLAATTGIERRAHSSERDGDLCLPSATLSGVRPPLVERSTMTITAPLFTDLELSDPDEMMKVTNNGKTPIRWVGVNRRQYNIAPGDSEFVPFHIIIRYMGDPRSDYKKTETFQTPDGKMGVIPERRGELIRLSILYGLYHGRVRELPKMAPKVTVLTLNNIAIEFPINNADGRTYGYQTTDNKNIDVRTELDRLRAQQAATDERMQALLQAQEARDPESDEAGEDTAPGM